MSKQGSPMIELLKKIPVDLGQGAVADLTEGKQIAKRLVPDGRNRSALDVGARNGTQSQWLKTRGYAVRSIDVEPRFETCELVNANEPLPFDADTFDLIWCSEVIEHLVNPEESLKEMLRVCKPGGRVILTTPNSYMWLFRMLKLVGFPPQRLQRADHLHFFKLSGFQSLCPTAEIFGYFPYLGKKWTIQSNWMLDWLTPTFVMCIDLPEVHTPTSEKKAT